MISSHLAAALAPFAQLANKHALSDLYKCIEVSPDEVRGCSAYGILEATLSIGIPETIYLDTQTFVSVIKSLPESEEVSFKIEGGALRWECGLAEGKLALMKQVDIPRITTANEAMGVWHPSDAFLNALDLGALSCGAQGMGSAGVYGILLDNRNDFTVFSSDNITVSACRVADKVAVLPEQVVLSPDAASLLSAVIAGNTKPEAKADKDAQYASLEISEKAVYCRNKAFRLLLRPIQPFKHDMRALTDNYASADSVANIPRERIASFVKRAAALAESKQRTYVTLSAAEGALSMSFSEGAATTDEYYLVEDLNVSALPEIKLDATRVARVLSHVDHLVLDHLERGVLLFRGKHPPFSYMIAGRNEKGA